MGKDEKSSASPLGSFLQFFYGNFIVLLLGFVSIPLITRVMSREQYGRTGMFTSAVTVLYIFAILGMDQAYIRYYYVKGMDRRKLMARCLFPALAVVMMISALYLVFSGPANVFLFGESGLDLTALVISYTVISVFERFLFLDIRMSQNGKLYSNLNITSKLIYIILIILFARRMGDDFRVVLWASTLSLGLITVAIGIRYLIRNHKGTGELYNADINNEIPYKLRQKELITYGAPFILVLLMEWLLSSCDKWSLRIWSDYGELGIYNSAMNIMSILLTFKATFVAFWSPVAMQKYEEDENDCKRFFKSAFKITRMLCILGGLGLILLRRVVILILGADYHMACDVIPFLTLLPVFSILFEITIQGVKFRKKNRYLNYASVAAILINLAGNALLVPMLGGRGAALATGITYIVYFYMGTMLGEKCYRVEYDMGKTLFYTLILFSYAFFAVFTDLLWADILFGMISVALVLFSDRKIVALCFSEAHRLLGRR